MIVTKSDIIFFFLHFQELGKELGRSKEDISIFSAGHTQHEWTSWSCMQEIFLDMDHAFKMKVDNTTDDSNDANDRSHSPTRMEEEKTEL